MTVGKPSVLILGHLDPTAATLVRYIVETGEAGYVRLATFSRWELCKFHQSTMDALAKVDTVQANLNNDQALSSVFLREDGSSQWDYVFLLNEYGLCKSKELYDRRMVEVGRAVVNKAAEHNAGVLVYFSSGLFYHYEGKSPGCTEETAFSTELPVQCAYQQVEELLREQSSVPTVCLRPALVYGPDMFGTVCVSVAIARSFSGLGEPVQSYFAANSPQHLVHIQDLVRAAWHTAQWQHNRKDTVASTDRHAIFNLSQPVPTTAASLAKITQDIFGIETVFSDPEHPIALPDDQEDIEALMDAVNEKIMQRWISLLSESNIKYTPISPLIEQEMLALTTHAVDGTRVVKETQFEYAYPEATVEHFREAIRGAQELGYWPEQDHV